jgi:hypothetical protein
MLKAGLAIARYDSRDGYGAHPREAAFIAADNASPNVCSTLTVPPPPPPQPPTPTVPPVGVYYENCTAARAAGGAPIYIGHPAIGQRSTATATESPASSRIGRSATGVDRTTTPACGSSQRG